MTTVTKIVVISKFNDDYVHGRIIVCGKSLLLLLLFSSSSSSSSLSYIEQVEQALVNSLIGFRGETPIVSKDRPTDV
jgi:hypothetical protein